MPLPCVFGLMCCVPLIHASASASSSTSLTYSQRLTPSRRQLINHYQHTTLSENHGSFSILHRSQCPSTRLTLF